MSILFYISLVLLGVAYLILGILYAVIFYFIEAASESLGAIFGHYEQKSGFMEAIKPFVKMVLFVERALLWPFDYQIKKYLIK